MPPLVFALPDGSGPTLLLLIASSAALALSVIHPQGSAIDRRIFAWINGRRLSPLAEAAVRGISHLGLMPVNALFWLVFAVKLWFEPPTCPGVLIFGCLLLFLPLGGLLGVWALCRGVKHFVRRTRPHLAIADARLVGLAPGGSSFPSSHAALAVYTALIGVFLLEPPNWIAVAGWLLIAIVVYARMYLGAHYPRDVLAGMALGAFGALCTLVTFMFLRGVFWSGPA